MLPLERYRMLDLSRLLPGPAASHILADMGMDVIKVEEPNPRYGMGRDVLTPPNPTPETEVKWAAYNSLARNKRSIALDLLDPDKRPESQEVFYRLAEQADVILEGYRPGAVNWMGVDYESVSARNPRIIYCSISGYGQKGPYVKLPGHDPQYCSVAGSLPMGENGPSGHGLPIADYSSGMYAAIGILTALLEREQSGQGQHIDVPMVGSVMSFLHGPWARYFREGELPQETSASVPQGVSYLQCGDGKYLGTSNAETSFWANFCRAIGREQYTDKKSATGDEAKAVVEDIQRIFLTKTRDEWLRILWDADSCAAPVNNIPDTLKDPQIREIGMVWEAEHPTEGHIQQIGHPVLFSRTPATLRTLAPVLGAHTRDVLRDAGFSDGESAGLEERGIVKSWSDA